MIHRLEEHPTNPKSQQSSALQAFNQFKRQSLRRSILVVLSAGLCTWSSTAMGQQWANPNNGNWSAGSNWTTGVPTEFENAVIDATGGSYQVDITNDQSVGSLTINSGDATVSHSAGVLLLGSSLVVSSGTYNLTGGSIAAGPSGLSMTVGDGNNLATFDIGSSSSISLGSLDTLTLQAASLYTNGTLTNAGAVDIANSALGASIIAGVGGVQNQANFSVDGSLILATNFTNGSALTVSGVLNLQSGTIVNEAAGVFTTQAGGTTILDVGTTTLNSGTMTVNGSSLVASGTLTNQSGGTLTLQNGISLLEGSVTNSSGGVINAMGGEQLTINTAGTLDNSGSFFLDSSTLIVSGAITNQSGGVLSVGNSSTMSIDGSLSNSGTFNVNTSILAVSGSITNSASGAINLLNMQTDLMSGSTLTNSGVLSIQSGASLYLLSGSTTTFASTGSLEGTGTLLNLSGSTQEINGNISPGDSAMFLGALNLLGDFALGNAATTMIQIDGTGSDSIIANNAFEANGNLNVSLINGFTLQDGLSWNFLTVASTFTGQFNNLGQDSLVGTFNGYDLFIDYNTGSGARLYSQISAVPEPSSLAFVCMATYGVFVFRRAGRKSKSIVQEIT